MPPKSIKTPREIIYYQYAKIISESSGFGKANYAMIMTKWKQLVNMLVRNSYELPQNSKNYDTKVNNLKHKNI